jgi:hypothetical protein
MSIFISGGVGAASYNPALSDPVVAAPSGIWHEVLDDGRSVPIFEPRDPGPCGVTRPCVGSGDGVDSTIPPVPLPMSLYMLVAGLFGLGVVRFFPQSLIDRPDRAN